MNVMRYSQEPRKASSVNFLTHFDASETDCITVSPRTKRGPLRDASSRGSSRQGGGDAVVRQSRPKPVGVEDSRRAGAAAPRQRPAKVAPPLASPGLNAPAVAFGDVHLGEPFGEPYDEDTFRTFLSIERRRSERSDRAFFLLLVALTDEAGVPTPIPDAVASELFMTLRACLRRTDFVGWYRRGRVAGAVLTESPNRPEADVTLVVGRRVLGALGERFSSRGALRYRVRVYPHPELDTIDSNWIPQLERTGFPEKSEDI